VKIKRISKNNYLDFYKRFHKIKDFKVSKKMLFYELEEIIYWINHPKENLLYGIFDKNICIGFCFCKIISNHWALIDNFYILPEYRNKNIGTKLQKYIEKILKLKGINYISRVTRSNNYKMHSFLMRNKYKKHHEYIWFDKFL
jgi:GNAT superfamily N-acetyltransferase